MNTPLQSKQPKDYSQHPDYNTEMGKAVEKLKIEDSDIPDDFAYNVKQILAETPFLSLNMDIETYTGMVSSLPSVWGVGIIQKGCHLILSQTPKFFFSGADTTDIANICKGIISPTYSLNAKCLTLLQKAHAETINTLSTRDKLKGIK